MSSSGSQRSPRWRAAPAIMAQDRHAINAHLRAAPTLLRPDFLYSSVHAWIKLCPSLGACAALMGSSRAAD